jgi:hypothetical protein
MKGNIMGESTDITLEVQDGQFGASDGKMGE